MSRRTTLDTSAYSAFKQGHGGVVRHLRRADEILLPSIVLGELLGGFAAGRQTQRNRDELELFQRSPRVRLVSIGEATAQRYAVIYASLRAKGQPIPTNDLWIAASTMEHATELVTLDRDFTHVAQILVALYEPAG
jgi:tRNA(fMet)-specific endonuclease VapC